MVDQDSSTTTADNSRVEQFKAEVADLGLRDPVVARERQFLRAGAAAMVVGVGWVVVAYFISHSTKNPLQQRDAFISAILGLTIAVVGAAVYLRYSFGRFLRFWLARLAFEQQHHTESVVGAVQALPASMPRPAPTPAPVRSSTKAPAKARKATKAAKNRLVART